MLPEEERAVLASSWKPGTYSLLSSFTTRFASVTYTLASTGTLALAFTDKFPFSGDWKCGDCAEHNFATRMTCRKCNFPKNFTKEELDSKDFKPGDWKCSNCSTNSCESMTDIKTHWKEKKIVDYKCLTDINTGDHNFASVTSAENATDPNLVLIAVCLVVAQKARTCTLSVTTEVG